MTAKTVFNISTVREQNPVDAVLDFYQPTQNKLSFRHISLERVYLQIAIACDMLTFIDFSKRRVSEILELHLFEEIAVGGTFSFKTFHRRFIFVKIPAA